MSDGRENLTPEELAELEEKEALEEGQTPDDAEVDEADSQDPEEDAPEDTEDDTDEDPEESEEDIEDPEEADEPSEEPAVEPPKASTKKTKKQKADKLKVDNAVVGGFKVLEKKIAKTEFKCEAIKTLSKFFFNGEYLSFRVGDKLRVSAPLKEILLKREAIKLI